MAVTPSSSEHAEQVTSSPLRDKVRSLQLPPAHRNAGSGFGMWFLVMLVIGLAIGGYGYSQGWFGAAPNGTVDNTSGVTPVATATSAAKTEAQSAPSESGSAPTATPAAKSEPARQGIVLESNGYFMPARKILVSPKVSGMLLGFHQAEHSQYPVG